MRYSVQRLIEAEPPIISGLLTHGTEYPDGNPAVLGVEGEIRQGETIWPTSIVNPGRQFKLRVFDVIPKASGPPSSVWRRRTPG